MVKKGTFSWTALLIIIVVFIGLCVWWQASPTSFDGVMTDIGFVYQG